MTYTKFQQLYGLNAASNAAGESKGTEEHLEVGMSNALDAHLKDLGGNWKVTWGPRVFKYLPDKKTTGPDHAWFVAVDDTQKICAISVAGTSSFKGWLEDFEVKKIVDFEDWIKDWSSKGVPAPSALQTAPVSGTEYAAMGTCTGAHLILSKASRQKDTGKTLVDYITNSVPADYEVIFTGHSMGGAIAPTVALGLVKSNLRSAGNTYILPSAGASPGNDQLAQAFKSTFPPQTPNSTELYAVWNTDYYNTLDVVPQAWSIDHTSDRNIANIVEKIYAKASPALLTIVIKPLVATITSLSKQSGIAYEPLTGTSFTGAPIKDSLISLYPTVYKEHTSEYWVNIGIQDWVAQFFKKLTEQPGVGELGVDDFEIPEAVEETTAVS